MNGSSTPYAPALKIGVCVTYSSGTRSHPNVVQFSRCIPQSRGNCVGPQRTALPWKSSRIPRSPPRIAMILRMTWSTPGMARSACSAARSAGCSHDTGAMSGKRDAGARGGERGHQATQG